MKQEITDHLGNKVVNSTNYGVSWIDLRLVLNRTKRNSQFWVGICHLRNEVFLWTPLDYETPITAIPSLEISPRENYCSEQHSCINFKCPINKFKKDVFLSVFHGLGRETLGLPRDLGPQTELWFNSEESQWHLFWGKLLYLFKMKPEGGKMGFSQKALDLYESGKTRLVETVTDPDIIKKIEKDNKELSRIRDWESEVV